MFEVVEGAVGVGRLGFGVPGGGSGGGVVWSISGGADAARFTLSAEGDLAFRAAADFEVPGDADGDNVYEVAVTADDGRGTAGADVSVTVLNAIELTSVEGPSAVEVAENHYGRAAVFQASSPADAAGVHWSVAGWDGAHFTIDAPPGVLRLRTAADGPGGWRAAADYENPADFDGDNIYDVIVVATAPDGAFAAQSVSVTVADTDEPGAIAWSHTRPRVGEPLTATLADPDGIAGPVTWIWERSAGRNNWAEVARSHGTAASSSSYTPTAADSGEFLRVAAHYTDSPAPAVAAGLHSVVAAGVLSFLEASTGDSAGGGVGAGWRLMRPAFDALTLHYSVGCADGDVMRLRFAAADGQSRLSVGGVAYANPGAGEPVTATVPVDGDSDVAVSVSDGDGGETRYVVYCLHEGLAPFTADARPGATEQLLLTARNRDLLILDANGVPRWRHELPDGRARNYFRFYGDAGGEFRYSYSLHGGRHIVLDEDLRPVDEVTAVEPLTRTGVHDFRVLGDGSYLLMAHEPAARDYSFLTFPDVNGEPFGTEVQSTDSAIQIVSADGEAMLTWNSWGHLPLEDCTHHWFPPSDARWAHVNSVALHQGEIVASFRGCNTVLGIDPATGEINWRVGPTNHGEPGFASAPPDPAPLAITGDPQGQFCGQHAASITAAGRLLVFDNGANCSRNPWTGRNPVRPDNTYSRAVEYHLDHENGEAAYVRERFLGGARDRIGWVAGHAEELDGGHWLVSWGNEFSTPDGADPRPTPPWTAEEIATATVVDPATGTELLRLHWPNAPAQIIRVTAMPASALAPQPQPLTATIHPTPHTPDNDTPGNRPQAVVAFNRPVADFGADTPSLDVRGATVAAIEPLTATGAPAHAYTITLTPHPGNQPITLALTAGHPCHTGGICTADRTPLTGTPPATAIDPAPERGSGSR